MKELKNLLDVLSERLHTPKMQKPIQDMPPVLSQEPTVSAEMTQMSVTQTYPHISSIQERGRRFFHKDGRPLMS
jgi:hypothetical protein